MDIFLCVFITSHLRPRKRTAINSITYLNMTHVLFMSRSLKVGMDVELCWNWYTVLEALSLIPATSTTTEMTNMPMSGRRMRRMLTTSFVSSLRQQIIVIMSMWYILLYYNIKQHILTTALVSSLRQIINNSYYEHVVLFYYNISNTFWPQHSLRQIINNSYYEHVVLFYYNISNTFWPQHWSPVCVNK